MINRENDTGQQFQEILKSLKKTELHNRWKRDAVVGTHTGLQSHLVLEVVVCDVDRWFAGLLEDLKIPPAETQKARDKHCMKWCFYIL